jgi:hypothetical protein
VWRSARSKWGEEENGGGSVEVGWRGLSGRWIELRYERLREAGQEFTYLSRMGWTSSRTKYKEAVGSSIRAMQSSCDGEGGYGDVICWGMRRVSDLVYCFLGRCGHTCIVHIIDDVKSEPVRQRGRWLTYKMVCENG